jgi:hypothetical protein
MSGPTMTTIHHDIRTASGVHRIEQHVDLDELVGQYLHVEDMGAHWHVALGEAALVCSINKRTGVVTVVEESGARR